MSDPMSEHERLIERLERARRAGAVASPEQQEENLRRLIRAAVPPAEVPESLRERVRALEAAPPTPARPRARRFLPGRPLGWTLAAAAVVAAIAAPVLQPRWVAAQALRRMAAAVTDARSAHQVFWRVSRDGRRVKFSETWYQGGRWRFTDTETGRVNVFASGKLWSYDPKTQRITVRRTSGPFGYNPSGFSLAAMARDYARWGWNSRIRVEGRTRVGGHPALQVVIERGGDSERELLLVDAESDLPISSQFQRETGGRWVTEGIAESRFNEPLPPALFKPSFPAGAKRDNWDALREQWRRRLGAGIARRRIARRLIVLRDLWVNPKGDVFLLYTASKTPGGVYGDWQVDLTDDRGVQYQEARGLEPHDFVTRPVHVEGSNLWPGFSFGGEKLKGKWWVPVTRQWPWQPRRFTLTFHVVPIDHPKLPTSPGGKTPGEAAYTVSGTFSRRVDRAGSTLVPPFMPFMFSQMDDRQIRREEAEARAAYFRQDPAQMYPGSRRQRRPPDLAKALASYYEIARMNEAQARKSGTGPYDPGLWTSIGRVLYRMGRREEARAAFERAIRESTHNDWSRQEPQQLLKGMNSVLAWTVGRPAPLVSGIDLNGKSHSVADYRGKVLLISLWNRFSHELPRIKALNDRYAGREFAVLGVCIDINRAELNQYVRAQNIPWPNLYDDKEYKSEVGARFGYSWDWTPLPRTLLVDREGIVRAIDLHGAALESAVARLMGGGGSAATSSARR